MLADREHLARLTDPQGRTFYLCREAPGYTPDRDKAIEFINAHVATRAGSAAIYGDSEAFWNSERESARLTRERMKGWSAEAEPV